MPSNYPRDRFDDVPKDRGRVGAHRAENPRGRGWVTFLWASVAAVVLFAGGVFGTLVMMDKIHFGPKSDPVATASAAPAEARIDTSYMVMILNATNDESKTEQVKQMVLAAGWTEDKIFTIDSDEHNFDTTTVYYPLVGDKSPALGLAGALGKADTAQSDVYQMGDTDESPQLTIVIGEDFGASAG